MSGKIQNFTLNLKQKPFIQSLINDMNAEVLAVGGVVRDLILNKPNKDIDLIVRNVPIDTLIAHLQKFGKVDVVGKSFGVLKFIDVDGVDYDIALPRKEKPNGEGGYRGFDVQSDENLPIEDDLIRRDAKMNAMAININSGKFVDPLGGLEDIEKKEDMAAEVPKEDMAVEEKDMSVEKDMAIDSEKEEMASDKEEEKKEGAAEVVHPSLEEARAKKRAE
jgi:tRNA nucleotidyltransferase (CCA-adding enzyme)